MNEQEIVRTDEQWRTYIHEASIMELDAIIEKGRRISEFHDNYRRRKAKYGGQGKTWDDECNRVIGINEKMCGQYENIYQGFHSKLPSELRDQLPINIYSLNFIARTHELNPDFLLKAPVKNFISPDMKEETAKELYQQAKVFVVENVTEMVKEEWTNEQIQKEFPIIKSEEIEEIRNPVEIMTPFDIIRNDIDELELKKEVLEIMVKWHKEFGATKMMDAIKRLLK